MKLAVTHEELLQRPILSCREVVTLTGVHKQTVQRMVRDGRLDATKSNGDTGRLLISTASVKNHFGLK